MSSRDAETAEALGGRGLLTSGVGKLGCHPRNVMATKVRKDAGGLEHFSNYVQCGRSEGRRCKEIPASIKLLFC